LLADVAQSAQPTVADAASPPPAIRAFAAVHTPRPLAFDPAKLTGLSGKLIRSHWENNYGGSVTTLNAVKTKLACWPTMT